MLNRRIHSLRDAVTLLLPAVAILGTLPAFAQNATTNNTQATSSWPAFAVVELFTSEGCSSCPPADALLSEIHADAVKRVRSVYTLAFHVDYWDRLGWADPFGDKTHSQRQRDYAKAFDSERVYTPQMIVNGTEEFVGSDRERARRAIDAALKQRPLAKIYLDATFTKDERAVAIDYSVNEAPVPMVLNIALVESGLVSKVERGENKGKTLRHDNVVRAFEVVPPEKIRKGRVTLRLPKSLLLENAAIVAYLQKQSDRAVAGATRTPLRTD